MDDLTQGRLLDKIVADIGVDPVTGLPNPVVSSSGGVVFGNSATQADQDALYALANPDPYAVPLAATVRNQVAKGSLGLFGGVLATVDAPGMAHVGVQGSVNMNSKRGWGFGVASTVRGDEDYSAGEEGLWGAEFDLCVLGLDGANKYSGTAQSTHGLLVASGSLRKPQYGFELFAGPGASTTTTAAGNVSDATIPIAAALLDSNRGYVSITKADGSIARVRYTGTSGGGLTLTGCTLDSGSAGAYNSGAAIFQQWAPFQYGLAFLYSRAPAVADAGVDILSEVNDITHRVVEVHLRDLANPLYADLASGNRSYGPSDASTAFDVTVGRAGVGVWGSTGDIATTVTGKGLKIAEGSNAKMGAATLVAGSVTVNTTAVTANSRIFLSNNVVGGGAGAHFISSRIAGTSFVIASTSGSDTSTVAWMIVEPT